ncbi:Beta-catenin-interacting protein 1 [Fukomys damarensis]|uniref:Beta-catenin-interacting protein 1 n=1 Tax=Fukomys damarensis TaxID=885580 RepID=A0A091E8S6_FUKDA|nr:Beta-catenin-interacting protein 1 [Fukomys damarensis]
MNREGAAGKSPEEMYIQQKVRVLLMLRKMGSNLTTSEEEFLRTYAGVVSSQLSQLPQHAIDQGHPCYFRASSSLQSPKAPKRKAPTLLQSKQEEEEEEEEEEDERVEEEESKHMRYSPWSDNVSTRDCSFQLLGDRPSMSED